MEKNRRRHVRIGGRRAGGGPVVVMALALVAFLPGCSHEEAPPALPVLDAEAIAALPAPLRSVATKVNIAFSPLALHDATAGAELDAEAAAPLSRVVKARRKALFADSPPRPLVDGIEFLDADFVITGPKRYTLRCLLRCVGPVERDYKPLFGGRVADEDVDVLPEMFRERRYVFWACEPVAAGPTSQWEPGRDYVLEADVPTEAFIPYRVKVIMIPPEEEATPQWVMAGWLVDF